MLVLQNIEQHQATCPRHRSQKVFPQQPSAEKERPATMPEEANTESLLGLAEQISGQAYLLTHLLKADGLVEPAHAAEKRTSHSEEISKTQENILGLTKKLTRLLQGPRGFLHEYIGPSWEHGALYAVLEFDVLEKIPLDGEAHVSELAAQSKIIEDKLLKILRLIACENIVEETTDGTFRHTNISKELVNDKEFKAFIAFQYVPIRELYSEKFLTEPGYSKPVLQAHT